MPQWVEYIRQEYPNKAKEVDIAAFADGQINGYSATAEIFPQMVGVGDIARNAWTQIFTLGKAPVSGYVAGVPADRSHPGQQHVRDAPFRNPGKLPPRPVIAASAIESG